MVRIEWNTETACVGRICTVHRSGVQGNCATASSTLQRYGRKKKRGKKKRDLYLKAHCKYTGLQADNSYSILDPYLFEIVCSPTHPCHRLVILY